MRRISVAFGGQPDANCSQPVISADGRYVAFSSAADNFVAGDDNAASDIFFADLWLGTIRRISVSSQGAQANGASVNPSISADGRYRELHVHGEQSGQRRSQPSSRCVPARQPHRPDRLVSTSARGRQQNASAAAPFTQVSSLSGDGHYIVFDSDATNLVRGDRNGHTDVFRHSLISGNTDTGLAELARTAGQQRQLLPVALRRRPGYRVRVVRRQSGLALGPQREHLRPGPGHRHDTDRGRDATGHGPRPGTRRPATAAPSRRGRRAAGRVRLRSEQPGRR